MAATAQLGNMSTFLKLAIWAVRLAIFYRF
jgi:hypothetical protein